jgi:tRNA A-37 threonylcarbamoyl transferase component Bud32
MACPSPDHVLDYLSGSLDDAARDALDAHVDGCATCRQLMVELARTDMNADVRPGRLSAEHIGRYKVEKKLGAGGMGTVYLAYDSQLDRKVAVKLVHPELAQYGGVERLVREGRALAKLSHPNVVGVHDAGTDGNRVYIAMELVEGMSLAQWLRESPRDWRSITEKFVAAGRGIAAAHRAGIIHRDIKPENILLDKQGRAKVADFGLAGHSEPGGAITDQHDTDRLTLTGAVMGTPMFMSPEQRRGETVSGATDQYSLCAALDGALHTHRHSSKPPAWLRAAILKGLAQRPSERFASMDDLIDALDPALRRRRNRRFAAAAGSIAITGVIAGAFYTMRDRDDTGARCDAERAAIEAQWRAPDRTALTESLRATKLKYADDTATRVVAAMDEYVKDLESARTEQCKQRPRTSEARALFELSIACLGERRVDLLALRDKLRTPSAADLRLAVTAVHELPSIDDCSNAQQLEAEARARATPELLATRTELSEAMRSARAAYDDGKYPAAGEHAQRAVALARKLGGRLLAKALLLDAEVTTKLSGEKAAEPKLREAIAESETAQADDLRAQALAQLARLLALQPGRELEAVTLEPLAVGAINRAKKARAYLPVLQQAMGLARLQSGEVAKALASFEAALASAREVLPHDDPRMPDYLYMVGVALSQLRRPQDALEYQREAYDVAVEAFGANHPNAARFSINFAISHAATGNCAKAIEVLTRSRALLEGVLAADSPEHLQIDQTLGACYWMTGKPDEALREYTKRQNALVAANRTRSAEYASSWVDVGDVQIESKAYSDAVASYTKAVKAYEDLVGVNDVRLALPLWRTGEAHLRANQPERAIEPLERAVKIYDGANAPAVTAADAWSRLGFALWSRPQDRARARELVIKARDGYSAGTMATAVSRVATMKTWLEAHK